jgi:hypothetical protein
LWIAVRLAFAADIEPAPIAAENILPDAARDVFYISVSFYLNHIW